MLKQVNFEAAKAICDMRFVPNFAVSVTIMLKSFQLQGRNGCRSDPIDSCPTAFVSAYLRTICQWLADSRKFQLNLRMCFCHPLPLSMQYQLTVQQPRAVTKFAALRILSQFASFKPDAVRSCNPDMETLITNSNRSIATFAITTLLKTGNESSVDRLMKVYYKSPISKVVQR